MQKKQYLCGEITETLNELTETLNLTPYLLCCHHVHHHEIGALGSGHTHGLEAVGGLANLVPVEQSVLLEHLANIHFVIYNQQFHSHIIPYARALVNGGHNKKS